jgi:hypothetical protein
MTERHPRVTPAFVLVGAPKSGTTAMYTYLSEHPAVFLPARKELHYFGSDLERRHRTPMSDADYAQHYLGAPAGAVAGTAFVWYLYSRNAAAEIAEAAPGALIIAMLRNPVDMLPALHAEHLSNGNEDIQDFAEALAAEPDRRAGRRIPPEAHLPQGLLYSEVPCYAEQLERYFQAFGRDRVHVVLFDDFRRDPAGAYADVLSFLELDATFRPPSFAVINPRHGIRSHRMRRFLSHPPAFSRRVARTVMPAPVRRRLWERMATANARAVSATPLPSDLRRQLGSMFADEITRLESLLGRDLAEWREEPS